MEMISEWWASRSIMAVATVLSTKVSPYPRKGLLLVTMMEVRSHLAGTSWKNRFAASRPKGK